MAPALVVRTKMIMKNGEHEVVEDRWELSADGKTLTTGSHIVTEAGEADLTLVCVKEDGKPNKVSVIPPAPGCALIPAHCCA